ncbi:hypothetical protein, partial [Vibrio rotiferianus]|uniref:hypothetical protein n=1 Tax=Vibrio rotiferianus TaxID=190895 RepID=UPI001C71254C
STRTQNGTFFLFVFSFMPEANEAASINISLDIIVLLIRAHNAQLRGEQRPHPNLKHCAINTKTEVEAKVPSVENPS